MELFEPFGRHNGTVDGVQYFRVDPSAIAKYVASHGANDGTSNRDAAAQQSLLFGVFVRPTHVTVVGEDAGDGDMAGAAVDYDYSVDLEVKDDQVVAAVIFVLHESCRVNSRDALVSPLRPSVTP